MTMRPPNGRRFARARGLVAVACCAAALLGVRGAAWAGPYIWDQDGDGIDDRMETVNLLGYRFAFVGGDTLQHERIDVSRAGGVLTFGMYVLFDHDPTATDLAALNTLGIPVHARLRALFAVHGT